MAVLTIRLWPDEVLRRKADQVEIVDDQVRRVLDDMAETMYRQNGIGLAAPQVGISRRIVTLDVPPDDILGDDGEGEGVGDAGGAAVGAAEGAVEGAVESPVEGIVPAASTKTAQPGSGLILAVNPRITAREGRLVITEGCLSFPGLEIDILRSERVTVEYMDESGAPRVLAAVGLLAVCFQHEIDHLDGTVFTDRVGLVRRRLALRDYERMRRSEA